MKRIRVTVIENYLLPDDWEITTDPQDHLVFLHGDHQDFLPALSWAQRGADIRPGGPGSPLLATWKSVDDERANWFIDQMRETDAEFREIE